MLVEILWIILHTCPERSRVRLGVRALDDLQGPRAMNGKASLQLGPGMATIGKDIALPGEDTAPKPAATPTVAVLDVGQTHISCDQQHAAIDQNMTLPTFGLKESRIGAVVSGRVAGLVGIG